MNELKAYLYQQCSQPGCTVMIRSAIGQQMSQPICRWCQKATRGTPNSTGNRDVAGPSEEIAR